MQKVFIAGGVSWDRIIQVGALPKPRTQTLFASGFRDLVGSTGAGKALNLARLGFDVTLHTPVGTDEAGGKIRSFLDQQPMKVLYHEDPRGTETHTNLMAGGQRISIYTSYGEFEPVMDLDALEWEIQTSDFVVLNIINYVRRLIPLAKKHGKKIWCDIHDYDGKNPYHQDFIDGADFVFFSSEGMRHPHRFMREMIRRGKELAVCTHGEKGAELLTRGGVKVFEPIVTAYPAVDTNGAGDSFFAGFLRAYSQGRTPQECMRMGTLTAALCVSSPELYGLDLSPGYLDQEYARHY